MVVSTLLYLEILLSYYSLCSSMAVSTLLCLEILLLSSSPCHSLALYFVHIHCHVAIQLLYHSRPNPSAAPLNHSHKSSLSYRPWNPISVTATLKYSFWCKTNMLGNMISAYSHCTCWLAACSHRRHMLCDNPHSNIFCILILHSNTF